MNRFKSFIAIIVVAMLTIASAPKIAFAGTKELEFSNEYNNGVIAVSGGDYTSSCSLIYDIFNSFSRAIELNWKEVHIQNNGSAWYIYTDKLIGYNIDISNGEIRTENDAVQIYDDSTGSAYCYKTPSGEYYYLPSFDDLKNENYVTEKVANSDIPKEPTPTESPTATSKPTATPKPSTSIGTAFTNKISVKKSGSSVQVTESGKVISKVTFNKKKGTATFKVKNKNKKVTKVKQAFIIGDSYNYGYITKANKFKTINRKTGKSKTYSGKWKKATIKKNVAVNVVKLKGSKKKKITGF